MSKKSASRSANHLDLKLSASRSLAVLLSLSHVGALALLIPIDAPWWLRLALGVMLFLSLFRSLSRHAWRSAPDAVTGLRWRDDEGLSVQFAHTGVRHAAVVRSRFVHRWLVLLSVRLADRRLPLALAVAADALDADGFRRLRAALLMPPRTTAE